MTIKPSPLLKKVPFTESKYLLTLCLVTSLFMLWGVAITMGDVLNRHFQKVLGISKAESGMVQLSIFGAYAVMGIPAGWFMKKYGYKNGVILGLLLYALGAFLFIPSANTESFLFFRIALFVLASGLATLETVAHPFVGSLGHPLTSDQRINFAQAFNGVGAVAGPLIGGYFILGDEGSHDLGSLKLIYVVIGIVNLLVVLAFYFLRVPPLPEYHESSETTLGNGQKKKLFQNRHFVFAVIAQFFNVAAQGGTWAFFIIYGAEKIPGMTDENAAYYFSLSMVMMMIGRFVGTFLMRYFRPNRILAVFALANIVLCVLIAQDLGWPSFWCLIMLNFFFSIMFPTIFSLGLKNLGEHTEKASSYIIMGVVGGAIFPPVMGLVANTDVATAYYLPIICYVVILLFAVRYYRTASVIHV